MTTQRAAQSDLKLFLYSLMKLHTVWLALMTNQVIFHFCPLIHITVGNAVVDDLKLWFSFGTIYQ